MFEKGYKPSEETRRKMSEAAKGNKKWLGKKHSEDTKQRISKAHLGKGVVWSISMWKNKKYRSWSKNKSNRLKKVKNKNGGSHTWGEWENLEAQYNWTCPCCKRKEPEITLTEDHIIPLSAGGSDNIENIQPLCKNCNCKKHTKIIKYVN